MYDYFSAEQFFSKIRNSFRKVFVTPTLSDSFTKVWEIHPKLFHYKGFSTIFKVSIRQRNKKGIVIGIDFWKMSNMSIWSIFNQSLERKTLFSLSKIRFFIFF